MDNSLVIPRGKGIGAWMGRLFLYALLLIFALYYLLPLFFMVMTSLKSLEELRQGTFLSLPTHPSFWAWWEAWVEGCVDLQCGGALGGHFMNSVAFTIPAVLISTFLGALNGFALTKVRFPGANIVFGLLLFGCFIPFQSILLPMAYTLGKLGLASSITGLILTHVVYGLCFTTLFFRNFYVTVPDELVQAATIDGAGFFSIFFRIMVPIALPIITVTLIWQFTQIWNDFLFGAAFTRGDAQPITVALNNLVNTSEGVKRYNVDMAAAMIAAGPTLLVYILAGKYFVRGLTAGAVKG